MDPKIAKSKLDLTTMGEIVAAPPRGAAGTAEDAHGLVVRCEASSLALDSER